MKLKKRLRRQIIEARRRTPLSLRREWDIALIDLVESDPLWSRAQVVMAYHAMPDEAATRPLLINALDSGKTLLLPRCLPGADRFEVVAVTDLDKQLEPGPLPGLWEPRADLAARAWSEPIDLVLVPGVAFDKQGGRLGYGKGMYDRFLETADYQICMGFAYHLQMVEAVPREPHDRLLDVVITEQGRWESGSYA